jgi:hypothetical protein
MLFDVLFNEFDKFFSFLHDILIKVDFLLICSCQCVRHCS